MTMNLNMDRFRYWGAGLIGVSVLLLCLAAAPDSDKASELELRALERRIEALEERVKALEAKVAGSREQPGGPEGGQKPLAELDLSPSKWSAANSPNAMAKLATPDKGKTLVATANLPQDGAWVSLKTDLGKLGKRDLERLGAIEMEFEWTGSRPVKLDVKLEDQAKVQHGKSVVIDPNGGRSQRITVKREEMVFLWKLGSKSQERQPLQYEALSWLDLGIGRTDQAPADRGELRIKSVRLLCEADRSDKKP
jgi:hypothetical protein